MADAYLLEAGVDRYELEDGSGVYLLEDGATTYTLTVEAGVYAITGSTIALTHGYRLPVTAGVYNIAGNSIALRHNRKITFTAGAYEITGEAIDLFYNSAEQWTVNFLVDLLPAESAYVNEYSARLAVDGDIIPIISWTYREEDQALTGRLDVQLARISDRSLITRDSSITFDLGTATVGDVSWETLLDTGQLEKTDYNITKIGEPDTFTLTAKPLVLVKLEKTPLNGYVLYDPQKHEIEEADWPLIYDTRGNAYTPAFSAIPGLDLYTILDTAFITGCGFSDVEKSIPNFEVGMVEFKAGESFMNTVGGLTAMFEPDFSELGDVLYIRDGTAGLPSGMPGPRQVGVSNARQMGVSADHNRANIVLLTYMADMRPYDSFNDRTEVKTEAAGIGDTYSETVTTSVYRDYFRSSNPSTPTRTETRSVAVEVSHNVKAYDVTTSTFGLTLTLTESSGEVFTYDAKGRLTKRRKLSQKRLPDANSSFAMGLIDAVDEAETVSYKMHPHKPLRTYIDRRVVNTSGLIFVDGDNPQLDEPYGQDANKVYQSGNVTDTQIAVWGSLNTYIEKGKPLRNGRVRYHITEIDQAAGAVTQNYEEERDGDLGVSSKIQEPQQVYVLQDDTQARTTDKKLEVHSGEAPLSIGIPLARRVLLQANVYPNIVSLDLIGIDNTLQKGTPIQAIGRDGENLGNYIIEARTMNGSREGHFMTVQVRQAS